MKYLRVTKLHSPFLPSEDCVHVIPSAVALSKCQKKKYLFILIAYLKRAESSTETFSLSLPAIWISNITESLWKAGHIWGALGKASFCRWGGRRNPLQRITNGSNKLSISCSPNNCTLNSRCGYLTDTVVLGPLRLPILPRKADLGRAVSESNTED